MLGLLNAANKRDEKESAILLSCASMDEGFIPAKPSKRNSCYEIKSTTSTTSSATHTVLRFIVRNQTPRTHSATSDLGGHLQLKNCLIPVPLLHASKHSNLVRTNPKLHPSRIPAAIQKRGIQSKTDMWSNRRPMHTSEGDADCIMDRKSAEVSSRSGVRRNRSSNMVNAGQHGMAWHGLVRSMRSATAA